VVFLPFHNDSIQRTDLFLAPALLLSASLTPCPLALLLGYRR
jgi:hypothetical protein